MLTNPSLDLAVAWGAAHFAWLRHTGGRRIGGGIARSYYLGVAGRATAASSDEATLTVLCVVPQHLEEGQEIDLAKPELELALGQPVLFPLYTSTVRGDDKAGDVLRRRSRTSCCSCRRCTPSCAAASAAAPRTCPVTLAARCTEIGTLELFCVAKDGGNRWRLEFNIRDLVKDADDAEDDAAAEPARRPTSGPRSRCRRRRG